MLDWFVNSETTLMPWALFRVLQADPEYWQCLGNMPAGGWGIMMPCIKLYVYDSGSQKPTSWAALNDQWENPSGTQIRTELFSKRNCPRCPRTVIYIGIGFGICLLIFFCGEWDLKLLQPSFRVAKPFLMSLTDSSWDIMDRYKYKIAP